MLRGSRGQEPASPLPTTTTTTPPPRRPATPPPTATPPPRRPLLIATYNPDEGALREHLLDRIAIGLSSDVPQSFDDRVKAIDVAVKYQDNSQSVLDSASELTDALRTNVGGAPAGGPAWLPRCCVAARQGGAASAGGGGACSRLRRRSRCAAPAS
jgi:hypothetical protein